MTGTHKLAEWKRAISAVRTARQDGKQIAFTNGCFDILHAGHVRYLTAARNAADMLVVGLNSDASVRQIKGERRPLNPEGLRAEVLEPDVLVKGADWAEDQIIGADFVKQRGGRVERVDLVPDISTSAMIETIRQRYC